MGTGVPTRVEKFDGGRTITAYFADPADGLRHKQVLEDTMLAVNDPDEYRRRYAEKFGAKPDFAELE